MTFELQPGEIETPAVKKFRKQETTTIAVMPMRCRR